MDGCFDWQGVGRYRGSILDGVSKVSLKRLLEWVYLTERADGWNAQRLAGQERDAAGMVSSGKSIYDRLGEGVVDTGRANLGMGADCHPLALEIDQLVSLWSVGSAIKEWAKCDIAPRRPDPAENRVRFVPDDLSASRQRWHPETLEWLGLSARDAAAAQDYDPWVDEDGHTHFAKFKNQRARRNQDPPAPLTKLLVVDGRPAYQAVADRHDLFFIGLKSLRIKLEADVVVGKTLVPPENALINKASRLQELII